LHHYGYARFEQKNVKQQQLNEIPSSSDPLNNSGNPTDEESMGKLI